MWSASHCFQTGMHESVAWKRLVTESEELTELRDKGHRPDAPHKDPISINSQRVSGREGGESKKSGKQRADDATERSNAHASRHMQTLPNQPSTCNLRSIWSASHCFQTGMHECVAWKPYAPKELGTKGWSLQVKS